MRWGHLNLTTCIGAGRGAGRALGGRWVGAGGRAGSGWAVGGRGSAICTWWA